MKFRNRKIIGSVKASTTNVYFSNDYNIIVAIGT